MQFGSYNTDAFTKPNLLIELRVFPCLEIQIQKMVIVRILIL